MTNDEMSKSYNWSQKITTVVTYSLPHSDLVCLAHERGVRVVLAFGTDWALITDPTARERYAQYIALNVVTHGLDGINMDSENVLSSPFYSNDITGLYFAVVSLVRAANPLAQCSVCIDAVSPDGHTWMQLHIPAMLSVSDFLLEITYDMSRVTLRNFFGCTSKGIIMLNAAQRLWTPGSLAL